MALESEPPSQEVDAGPEQESADELVQRIVGDLSEASEEEVQEHEEDHSQQEKEEVEKEPKKDEADPVLSRSWDTLTRREEQLASERKSLQEERRSIEQKFEEQKKLIEQLDSDAKSNPLGVLARAGWTEKSLVQHIVGKSDADQAKKEREEANPELAEMRREMASLREELSRGRKEDEERRQKAHDESVERDYRAQLRNLIGADDSKYALLSAPELGAENIAWNLAIRTANEGAKDDDLTHEVILDRVQAETERRILGLFKNKVVRDFLDRQKALSDTSGQSSNPKKTQGVKTLTNRLTAKTGGVEAPELDDEEGLLNLAVSSILE